MKDQTKKKEFLSDEQFRLAIIHHQACGIDVGSTMMMVAYDDTEGNHHLLETSAYTEDLDELAKILKTAGVQKVAMEATGVYWMALYELLEHYGIDVTLVNPQHLKNVAGQKTDVKDYLRQITGIDLTKIEGMDEINILEIISVTGLDMNKWPTENHFASWLNLSPRPKKSGGKVIGYQQRFTKNQATQCFRMAAQTMWQNKGPLGHLYRRLSYQKGSKKAIKAVARKLAVIFYCMLKNKKEYEKNRLQINTEKHDQMKIARLIKEAAKYGLILKNPAA